MDDANRIALDKAFELYSRHQGQPWSAENLVAAAETFRVFLDAETTMEPLLARIEALEEALYALERLVDTINERIPDGDPKAKRTRQPSASEATSTTHPDDEPLDLTPDDVPTPVDF